VSDNLPDDPETLKAMLLAERHESEPLRQIIKELQRHCFGRKAESLAEEQMLLGLEDVQQVAAFTEASQDETAPEGRAERARKRRNHRGALPAHLPRIEVVVDPTPSLPLLQGRPAPDRRRQERAAGHGAGAVPRCRHPSSQIRLPSQRRWRPANPKTPTAAG